jgi:HEAT repeat protein
MFTLLTVPGLKMNAQTNQDICILSLEQLKQAVTNGETFFIKVHAAENLIHHHETAGLEEQFLKLQQASPDNVIGSVRVLTRLNKHNADKYKGYINQLLQQFEHGTSLKVQLTALESLGKLGYNEPLPAIKAYADTGNNGFKGMACWILANSGAETDENRLSELLLSTLEIDYRYAAYALRFKAKTNALTTERLKNCLQTIKADDAARVYVASSLFVHSKGVLKREVKAVLMSSYLHGETGQRYEVAEALGLGGNKKDLPELKKLLADENTDVRVAAANAILWVMHYNH